MRGPNTVIFITMQEDVSLKRDLANSASLPINLPQSAIMTDNVTDQNACIATPCNQTIF